MQKMVKPKKEMLTQVCVQISNDWHKISMSLKCNICYEQI